MLPEDLLVDRPLPDPGAIEYELASQVSERLDASTEIVRRHRLFYPVFRVEYRYETSEDGLLSDAETTTGVTILDGLWTDNHAALQQYRPEIANPARCSLGPYDFGREQAELGRTVLLDFQVPSTRAERLFENRVEDVRESGEFDDPTSVKTSFESKLFETFGLPAEFDVEGYRGIDNVARLYLPFWVFELARPEDSDLIVALRSVADTHSEKMERHGWLSAFLSEDKSRLGQFAHDSLWEPEPTTTASKAAQQEATEASGGAGSSSADSESASSATASEGSAAESPASQQAATGEPIQPEDTELDAGTLVETSPDRSFGDVGGMDELKQTIRRSIIGPVQRPEQFQEYGLDPVSGVLFHGPPGCGKTYIAGAIAGELNWSYLEVSPADLSSKYMGKPAENVQDVFSIAGANSPCVVLLDEIDAIASAREDQSNTSERGMVNQLLTELEAVPEDVLVLAATNIVDEVDDAILRTGRFDERIEVPPPDASARREILALHLEGRPVAEDLSLDTAIERTAGYAASDLEYIATDAARRALRADEPIDSDQLLAAVEDTDSSVPDWAGSALGDGKTVTQPDDVELSARSLVTASVDRTFEDVGGMADLKGRLTETVIDPVKNAEEYEEYGIDVTSGVLLYGPPGCGKTYVTGALAGELDWSLLEVSPAELTSKWMGKPAQNVADLFEIARANEPCLLFLDEIDAIASSRSGGGPASQRQLVNQLLTELETINDRDVVVVGATNLVEEVDDAILRSGRFNERIEVGAPDAAARREILELHLSDRPVDEFDWGPITDATAGYAGSDLALLADNAARRALRENESVSQQHLLDAVSETQSSIDDWGEQPQKGTAGQWYG